MKLRFVYQDRVIIVCMVGITYVHINTIFAFFEYIRFLHPSLLLSLMFEHYCLDTCCFICMCIVFLYLRLFNAVEHVSREKAL